MGNEKSTQNFSRETLREETTWGIYASKMDRAEIRCENVDWIYPAEDMIQ
jgi:hypothetical protein